MDVLQKIKDNALDFPDITAVDSDHDKISYADLWLFSDRLASYIIKTYPKNKKPLVVYGHKSTLMITAFLACLKSGRAYVPIDVSLPIYRVSNIIYQVDPDVVICTESCSNLNEVNILDANRLSEIINNDIEITVPEETWVTENDLAYIIFTSGSTGTPKGVQIKYGCINRFIKWALSLVKSIEPQKVFINQAPFSFDLSVYELYMSLVSAGTLFCLTSMTQSKMSLLFETLKRSNGNIWVSTPSFADLCLSDSSFNFELMPNLEVFLFCGETLTNKTARFLLQRFHKSAVINTYGPTESTVAVTAVEITEELLDSTINLPVGFPKPGTWIKIVDVDMNELPDDSEGEIIIVGDTVSSGYYKQNELSKHAFTKYYIDGQEYCAYKTGDSGYVKNNMLFYSGRIDFQIKLNGYRVELGDIESNIQSLNIVRNVAVVPHYQKDKADYLAAFIVLNFEYDKNNCFAIGLDIKKSLKNCLPNYMIPKVIKIVESLPRTNNGKIDRKTLTEHLS